MSLPFNKRVESSASALFLLDRFVTLFLQRNVFSTFSTGFIIPLCARGLGKRCRNEVAVVTQFLKRKESGALSTVFIVPLRAELFTGPVVSIPEFPWKIVQFPLV